MDEAPTSLSSVTLLETIKQMDLPRNEIAALAYMVGLNSNISDKDCSITKETWDLIPSRFPSLPATLFNSLWYQACQDQTREDAREDAAHPPAPEPTPEPAPKLVKKAKPVAKKPEPKPVAKKPEPKPAPPVHKFKRTVSKPLPPPPKPVTKKPISGIRKFKR